MGVVSGFAEVLEGVRGRIKAGFGTPQRGGHIGIQRNAASDLSDIYAEIQGVRGGGNFVYRFQHLFNARGKKIEENILNPVFHAIQTAIEQLEQVKLGETDNYDSAESESAEGPRRRNQRS